jgi:hypothetical protein
MQTNNQICQGFYNPFIDAEPVAEDSFSSESSLLEHLVAQNHAEQQQRRCDAFLGAITRIADQGKAEIQILYDRLAVIRNSMDEAAQYAEERFQQQQAEADKKAEEQAKHVAKVQAFMQELADFKITQK